MKVSLQIIGLALYLAAALSSPVYAADADTDPASENDELFYFFGAQFGEALAPLHLTDTELQLVLDGARDSVTGKSIQPDPDEFDARFEQLLEQRQLARLEKERPLATAYLERMAAEDGARRTGSGLIFRSLKTGNGASPDVNSRVNLKFSSSLRDGTELDRSPENGQPTQVLLRMTLPCWQEGIALIKEGGKAKLTCPADLAYQDKGMGRVPPGAAISFEVELVKVLAGTPPAKTAP